MRESLRGSLWRLRVLSCAVALSLSCGSEEEDPPPQRDELAPGRIEITGGVVPGALLSGETTLEAVAEDNSGRLARVAFFVSGALACADDRGRPSGSTFSCTWDVSSVPEGNYELIASAQDAAGNTATSLPMPFAVGQNQPPAISAVSASPTSVNEAEDVTLSVSASDQPGETLAFSWSQVSPIIPAGTFTGADTATPTWKAPLVSATGTFTLQVTVSDGKGGLAHRTVDLRVVNVPAANRPPVVDAAISAPGTVLAGDTAVLSIGAVDPDGDPLTYTWRTNPVNQGTLASASNATASWRSGDIATATDYELQVTVSDGMSSVTRSVTVRATVPRYSDDIQPVWDEVCTSCHDSTSPGGGMNLLSASSYADLVGVNGNNRCGGSTAIQRVRVSQPGNSLLVRKISGTSCGTRMPSGNTPYFVNNPGLITRIRSWILAGAPNN